MDNVYVRASELANSGHYEASWKIVGPLLNENPLDPQALVTGSFVLLKMGALPQAYHFARSATQIVPNEEAAWTNLGHAASQLWLGGEADRCYRRALQLCTSSEHRQTLWLNMAALAIDSGDFEKAESLNKKLLEINPTHKKALANMGFLALAQRRWEEGWKGYRHTIGSDFRQRIRYGDEPEWDGTPGKTVALYAEQGLGDEISFASMLPDAARVCKKLILDCDARLEGLFKRSFPEVKVYGTRYAKAGKWAKEDWEIDASLPMGQVGEYFRNSAESFPGTPYLVPCPVRLEQWRAIFEKKDKPAIGVAWTGGVGVPKSNERNRRVSLNELLPIFRSVDAQWVSLQYKDAKEDIAKFRMEHPEIDLVQYPWATLTQDYDDTAALISALDYVVCIQTAVAHTSGALGVPVMVFVPVASQWRYGTAKDSIPWYSYLKVVRQAKHGSWTDEIERGAAELAAHFRKRATEEYRESREMEQGECKAPSRHLTEECTEKIPGRSREGSDEVVPSIQTAKGHKSAQNTFNGGAETCQKIRSTV
ncbi:MAG: hypothetical protein ACREQ5_09645 [Candidatus Dormibacteria bacterium]